MKHAFAALLMAAGTGGALADQVDRWVIGGTFATSGYKVNPVREKTYLRASAEDKRLLSFLPGMTILYGGEPLDDNTLGYEALAGVTQSGIPVAIRSGDVSVGSFSSRPNKDVVVHHTHLACRTPGCAVAEKIQVGIGQGFNIESEDDLGLSLVSPDELRVYYRAQELDDLERDGNLTRHQGRKFPRIGIIEGYASEISMPCGETRAAGTSFRVSEAEYSGDPSQWDVNSPAWSAKVVELFNIGSLTNLDGEIEVQLSDDIAPEDEGTFALDFTAFAFKDALEPETGLTWVALLSVVHCEARAFGSFKPTYIDRVWFATADDQIDLPAQLKVDQKAALFPLIKRSFFYSFNSAQSFFDFFPELSARVGSKHMTMFLISRLNATCASGNRTECDRNSQFKPISDLRPVIRPGT